MAAPERFALLRILANSASSRWNLAMFSGCEDVMVGNQETRLKVKKRKEKRKKENNECSNEEKNLDQNSMNI